MANCRTILYTDLQVKTEQTSYVNCYENLTIDYSQLPLLFKCRALDSLDTMKLNLHITQAEFKYSNLTVKIRPDALPTESDFILHCAFPASAADQIINFLPQPSTTHYIYIDVVDGNTTYIRDCESYASNDEEAMTIVDLMRDDKDKFFGFDYGLPTTDLTDVTSLVNLTSNEIKALRFKVNQFLDIGGSLTIEASLLMSIKYYMGYKREIKNAMMAFTEDNQFFKVVICLELNQAGVPLESGKCKYNDVIKPALLVLNSTDSDSIYDKIIIPFPEGGLWYMTLKLFCDSVVCPCRTSDNATKYYVNTTEIGHKETSMDSFSDILRQGVTECNTTVVLSVSSKSCVGGKCSNNGNCGYNTFSGIVMSFCGCTSGYGGKEFYITLQIHMIIILYSNYIYLFFFSGWDCSDDSRIDSQAYLLLSVLLLTLSNLLFILSIYVAFIRLYILEGVMYGLTMVFSTFYHACDAPAQVAYCIIRGNLLQFGDFYCGLMSFWVTLLAMSIIGTRFRAFFQVLGAILIALLTTWNMHSFVAFLLPVAIGALILFVSWYIDYKKSHFMRYPTSYYTRYMPLGLILVSVGLICYAFLQTEQNYKIVHSLWHMIIALSVVFLLPDSKRRNCHPFVASREYFKWPFCSYHRSQSP